MGWLRHALIDIAATVIILIAVFASQVWALWIVWIYTPFLLLLKIGAFTAGVGRSAEGVPDWFYHLLYAANVVVLLFATLYWVAGGWVAIWLLSAIVGARQSAPGKAGKKGS
jgi:hypothetical protein